MSSPAAGLKIRNDMEHPGACNNSEEHKWDQIRCELVRIARGLAIRLGLQAVDAEDAVQSVLLRALQATTQAERYTSTVVLTVFVHHRLIDLKKRRDSTSFAELGVDCLGHEPDPYEQVERSDEILSLYRHIAELPCPYREILLLRARYDWSRFRIEALLVGWLKCSGYQANRLIDDASRLLRGTQTVRALKKFVEFPPPPPLSIVLPVRSAT